MENSSAVTSVLLTAFNGLQNHKIIYFVLLLLLYTAIIVENTVLISVIYVDRSLHEPMYLYICNLSANNLFGSTALLPSLLTNLLSYSFEVPLAFCKLQIYCIHTYAIIEFTILAVMCYDRYVAICHPLHYPTMMSISKVYRLVVFSWLYPSVAFALFFTLTLRLTFCQAAMERIYCINYALVRLSCTDTSLESAVGLLSVAVYTFPQLFMMLYSYIRILKICFYGSKESRRKALKTCTPHILNIVNYSLGCFFEIAQSRFPNIDLSFELKIFLSVYFLILTPFINPAIYGLSIQAVRQNLVNWFTFKKKIDAV